MIRLRLDLRDTLRLWRRRPLLNGLAVLTLALATGANTTFLTLVDVVLLRTKTYRGAFAPAGPLALSRGPLPNPRSVRAARSRFARSRSR
jgi:hypothetical protein